MFRPTARQILRSNAPRGLPKSAQSRRLLSTAPPHQRSRTWKNSAVRWGLAGTLVYYYNTSNLFADEPAYAVHAPPESRLETETLPTLDEIAAQKQARRQAAPEKTVTQSTSAEIAPASPGELEEEAGNQGAFNEETGEINWDCPCLGGMAHGPCGEEFRSAFSCFVFSKEEPKGVDCIDRFKGMQDCFRQHPDIYGAELEEDESGPSPADGSDAANVAPAVPGDSSALPSDEDASAPRNNAQHPESDQSEASQGKRERAQAAKAQVTADHGIVSESDELVPKAWHDSTTDEKSGQ